MEGPGKDPEVERLRTRQIKNYLTATILSLGLPMFVMGDEVRRTQRGNNNAYCQDNEVSWFDWSLVDANAGLHRFVSLLNARRMFRNVEIEMQRRTLDDLLRTAMFSWHGTRLGEPDWGNASHSIALTAELKKERLLLHFIFNAYLEPLEFELPQTDGGGAWRRWIDTALESPQDITPWREAAEIPGSPYRAESRSVVVLFAPLSGADIADW